MGVLSWFYKADTGHLFDKSDYDLLAIVNEVLERSGQPQNLSSLISDSMHPHGIKELAAPKGLRIAYASACLLGSLETGKASDRTKALRSLRDEVLLSSTSYYQKNTARVLLQIMKELLRCRDNQIRQLQLAHDFRMVSTGKPRLVRSELAKYHLLEMPEEWNQVAFDDHVHDANTKGRKSPTHLVMDAWIKGIRSLTVVYYNFIEPPVVEELLEASEILDMRVQVGIELSARYRGNYVRFTWEPHGFRNNHAFLQFLHEKQMETLMNEGRQASRYQQRYVFDALEAFNSKHRLVLEKELALDIPKLQKGAFLRLVGTGQPSLLHLAKYIHQHLENLPAEALVKNAGEENGFSRTGFLIDLDTISQRFLLPCVNPELPDVSIPREDEDVPELLQLAPEELLDRLFSLHTSSRFTLNIGNISVQDALELIYLCRGKISHIETYNLKDASHGQTSTAATAGGRFAGAAVDLKSPQQSYALISQLQSSLNEDNVILLKRAIRAIIWDYEKQRLNLQKLITHFSPNNLQANDLERELQAMDKRKDGLLDILGDIETLHGYYQKRTLGSRVGSSSTGQTEYKYGMGMVVLDTLPDRARRMVLQEAVQGSRTILPISAGLTRHSHSTGYSRGAGHWYGKLLQILPLVRTSRGRQWQDWTLDNLTVHPGRTGNVATLGGLHRPSPATTGNETKPSGSTIRHPLKYLNTNLKNSLKVLIGFIPAFLTFSLTKDWWFLAYFGAVIWFAITGSRNVIQSVLGGGGLRRSPLLPWNSLVSWSRIADSLLYTGFSVPLLDFLVKTVLLDKAMGVTTATNPVLLYSVMGLANGIYISGHNIFRGLPRNAAIGNFFRSILAIPLAIVLNTVFGQILLLAAVPQVDQVLQKWAAVISKLASDCVAAVIEGLADRHINIRIRLTDYRTKISQLFAAFAKLDVLLPEEDVLDMLQSPKQMMDTISYEARDLEKSFIVNGLDLMYFWLYQPRARKALEILLSDMSKEEWLIFYRCQLILRRYREISQVFVDGLVGRNFSKALSFYLDNWEVYLKDLADLEKRGSPAGEA